MKKGILFIILSIMLLIPCTVFAEDNAYGIYEHSIEGLHIKPDGFSQAEVLKYEAVFKQAFATLVIDNSYGNNLFTVTIKTNKFTFKGRDMFISGIDALVIEKEGSEPVGKSMNVGKNKDGCPSSFTYTFDLTKIFAVTWSYNITVKALDDSFEQTFTITSLGLKLIKFTALDNTTEEEEQEETPTKYNILSGGDATFEGEDLVITADGQLSKLLGIRFDDNDLDKSNYDLVEGSTILTLKTSFLETVKPGKHKVTFVYNDGEVDTYITIKEKEESNILNPQTGDNIYTYVTLFIISFTGLAVLKKRYN